MELHDWVVGRYGSETPIDSGGATPRDARVLVGVVGMHDARDPTVAERSHLEDE